MQHSSEHPKTSTPPIGSVKKMFEFLSQNHQHVFAVSISSQMSTTFNVFTEVANTYNNISVVDSRRNSGAHGSIVTAIGKLAKAGCSYQAIQKQINKLIESTSIVVLVDNFKTMRKSGRVSKGRAYFADMINLKPLVGIDSQGRGEVLAKNFSRRGQQKKLMKILQQQHLEKPIKAFRVLHVDCLEGAQHIQSLLTNIYDNIPCEIMHASASVSLHAGKGTVAVSTE
jgi:DegV family protein with EDD domain